MTTGIGEALRAARRQQGRSLADAAAATRVRESYLAALEEEEFAALGGDVYVKGFLRSYARFLGLNPEPLLEAYRREHERPDDLAPLSVPSGRAVDAEGRRGLSPLAVFATVVFAVLALFLLFSRGGDEPTGPPAPSPVEATDGDGSDTVDGVDGVDDTSGTTPTLDPNAPAVEPTDGSGDADPATDDGTALDADAG